jgi:tetratricopeptide (TPR) repeat protein
VESVAWVTERKDVLSGFFFMLALCLYARFLRRRTPGRYLLLCLVFALGLLSKSMVVTLPFVLLLLDYWPLARWPAQAVGKPAEAGRSWRDLIYEKGWLMLLAVAGAAAQMRAVESIDSSQRVALPLRLENAVFSTVVYLRQFFVPVDLGVYYPHPGNSLSWWVVAFCLALIVGVSAIVWGRRQARPYLLTGWCWYLGMLAPVIGIVQSGLLGHADRYTYLPGIGIALALAWAAGDALEAWPPLRWPGVAVACALLAACATLTWRQSLTWASSEELFRQAIRVTRNNALAHLNLGDILWTEGRREEGLEELEEALREAPHYGEAHLDLATMLVKLGRSAEGLAEARQAVALMPDAGQAHHSLGLIYAQIGQAAAAITELREACRLSSKSEECFHDLGIVLQQSGQAEEAVSLFRTAARQLPASAGAHLDLASALFSTNHLEEAAAEFGEVIRIAPNSAPGHNGLGSVLFLEGKLGQARAEYERALALQPNDAEARRNLEGLIETEKNAGR